MPDIPDRTDREARLAALLRRAMGRSRARLIEALGDPPDVANVPDSLWEDIEAEVNDETHRALLLLFLLGASSMEFEDPVTQRDYQLDPDAAGDAARDYADMRAATLAGNVTETLRSQLSTAVRDATLSGMTSRQQLATLNSRLREIASNQADAAGITELTSANSAGEVWYKRQYEAETGIELLGTWHTDPWAGEVCEICAPLNGMTEEVWSEQFPDGPAVHPRCNCFLTWEAAVPAQASVN